MNLKSKKLMLLITVLFLAITSSAIYYKINSISAGPGSYVGNRTRYMSDVLRITEGISPVLWIDPQYSYISNAKYFDLSGNGNHGTQDTVAYQPTVAPPGLNFDGTNDYVALSTNASLLSATGSFEAWIKPADTGIRRGIYGVTESTYTDMLVITRDDYNRIYVRIEDDDVILCGVNSETGTLADTNWHHIAVTQDGTQLRIYIDGINKSLSGTNGGAWTSHLSPPAIRLGYSDGYGGSFNGTIDEVRIYNRALSATQIQQLYLLGLPKHRQ